LYAPKAEEVQAILAADNLKLFVKGEQIFKFHPMPRYYELRDGFAFKPSINLKGGWNPVLVKIEHDAGRFGLIVFSLRLADKDGMPMQGLLASSQPGDPKQLEAQEVEARQHQE
jgi:hypothetical protein